MRRYQNYLRVAILLSAVVAARADVAFSYRNAPNQSPTDVLNLGQINTASTLVGATSTITLIMQNTGAINTSLTSIALTGNGFATSSAAGLPLGIPAGGSLAITIGFTPTAAGVTGGSITLAFADDARKLTSYTFLLNGNAIAPLLVPSYVLNPSGNQTPLGDGATIPFASTAVNSTATASISVVNQGTAPGTVTSVSVTGASFRLTNLPLLPASVAPGATLTFNIAFTPTARGSAQGTLKMQLDKAATVTAQLTGQGAAAVLTYEVVTGGNTVSVNSGGTIPLGAATVGTTNSTKMQVRNTGDLPATISNVSFVGSGFSSTDLPPLPATLAPGGTFGFTIVFSPKAIGSATATLFIDGFSAILSGTGNGAQFTLTSQNGSTRTSVPEGGTVVFPNITLGMQGSVQIIVTNAGNASGIVNGVSVTGAGFSLQGLPALPATLAPNGNIQFTVLFAPTSLGTVTGNLLLDSTSFVLRGIADAPPALSTVSFSGLPSSVQPLQQPTCGMSLSQPYPFDLIGQVTLSVQSDSFVNDPTVQFATGGRTVPFKIPANTTAALFGSGNSQQISFQTGTVAGTITLAANFAIGSVDITPAPAPSTSATLAFAAPQITNLTIGTITGSAFEVLVTGYSTPRSMTQMNMQFAPSSGASLQTTSLSMNVAAAFNTWYQSASGAGFGSQFTASVPVGYSGPLSAVRSVSVSVQNSVGTSNVSTVNLQ